MSNKQTPFFMRFVETQANARVETEVAAGADDKKRKAPKDWPPVTFKYPSDYDEEYTIGWP